jgi:hypothetical protein
MRKLLVALFAVLTLAGCTAEPTDPDTGASVSEVGPASSTYLGPVIEVQEEPEAEAEAPIQPIDTGPRTGATGAAESDGNIVTSYVVAEGDVAIEISQRFGVELDQLADTGSVRLGSYPTLYVGDVITFVPQLTGDEANCFYRWESCGPD